MTYANLAWGVRLDDPDHVGCFHKSLLRSKQITQSSVGTEVLWDQGVFAFEMKKLFNLPSDPPFPDGPYVQWTPQERDRYGFELGKHVEAYQEAVPVTPAYFGGVMGEYGHHLIVFRRTWQTATDMNMVELGTDSLEYPSVNDIQVLDKILDHFGFTGNRTINLFLAASYE